MVLCVSTLLGITFIVVIRVLFEVVSLDRDKFCYFLPPIYNRQTLAIAFIGGWIFLIYLTPYTIDIYMCLMIIKRIRISFSKWNDLPEENSTSQQKHLQAQFKLAVLIVSHTFSYLICTLPISISFIFSAMDLFSPDTLYAIYIFSVSFPIVKMIFSLPLNMYYSMAMRKVVLAKFRWGKDTKVNT